MSASGIYILSQPIQSGKTTLLLQWLKTQQRVGGFLTPDIDGSRKLLDLTTHTYHTLQLTEQEEGIKIGRFVFDRNGFAKARQLLTESIQRNDEWVIVDEIGRLELDRKEGLEPELSVVIDYFRTHHTQTKLLLVVRDYLLEDVKKHYQIHDAIVPERSFFLTAEEEHGGTQRKITGVVLCGGQSVRMGRDKALIRYHSVEQYLYVTQLLKPFCDDVVISCNTMQQNNFSQDYTKITDNATFNNAGPMTGVLSVLEQLKNQSLLVVGCDYPYLNNADIKALIDARDEQSDVVCYHHPDSDFDEPLVAIYEKQCAPLLLQFFQKGQTSLRHFLSTVRTKRIDPVSAKSLTSIDRPDQYQ
jgi:molybdopterin-guanine dinucleotide biosynthesis protein A/nucleoside-triphosphatase THEP1